MLDQELGAVVAHARTCLSGGHLSFFIDLNQVVIYSLVLLLKERGDVLLFLDFDAAIEAFLPEV